MIRTTASLLASLAVAGLASASASAAAAPAPVKEDSLYSRHLSKRFIDDDGHYNISFYHINDVHAHLDEFNSYGTDCTDPSEGCYGGYSRVKNYIDSTRPSHQDSLVLNVGDEFQGTMYFTYYGGEKIAEAINQIGFDAMTLGNHEFDNGDDELGEFLQNLTFPIVSANIHSDHPVLNKTILPYYIFDDYNLAVIGVTTTTVPSISSPGKGTTFSDAVEAVQAAVDEIKANSAETGVQRIAAITHIGYEEDKKLAQATTGLHLIMGGHSHTLIGDMEGAEGKYPTIETNQDGDEVFIVTAYRWGEYLGYIDVTYDDSGKILAYHGAPVHMDNSTKQDAEMQAEVEEWAKPFEAFENEKVGETEVYLDETTCQDKECTLGDLMCEAIFQYRVADGSSDAVFSLINAGGVRASIDIGTITRGEVLTAFPFGNAVVEVDYTGQELWTIFEGLVSGVNQNNGEEITSFFQVSTGVKVEYNPDNEVGSRLVALEIQGEDVDMGKTYTIVTMDFMTGGGDNILEPIDNVVVLDTMSDVLIDYIGDESPINFELDGRIAIVDGSAGDDDSGDDDAEPTPTSSTEPSATPTGEGAGSITSVGSSAVLLVFTALLYVVVA